MPTQFGDIYNLPLIQVETSNKRQVIDITELIENRLPDGSGLVNIFVKHTTCSVTTADLDPGTDEDFLDFLKAITPNVKWRHPHDPAHAPDHLLASLIGPDVSVPYAGKKLQLGTWQRVILVELNGPKTRQLEISFLSA